ncbi:MAG: NRDE family protein [Pseudomonadales bacterium]|nr:NRDE family protein [Pseudomonadales bacterium]
MCTLTWFRDDEQYQVFFNRDEQRTRQQANIPSAIEHQSITVLLPIDPDGGGSWISVNQLGLTLCLLNYYQGSTPAGRLISRGKLLRSFAHLEDIEQVAQAIKSLDLMNYAPFSLVAFARSSVLHASSSAPGSALHTNKITEQVFQWDGKQLGSFAPNNMMTSSSVSFDEVFKTRTQLFAASFSSPAPGVNPTLRRIQHKNYHATDDNGDKNYRAVCMHREDAKTVSFSHISVINQEVTFNYIDGSPCESSDYVPPLSIAAP